MEHTYHSGAPCGSRPPDRSASRQPFKCGNGSVRIPTGSQLRQWRSAHSAWLLIAAVEECASQTKFQMWRRSRLVRSVGLMRSSWLRQDSHVERHGIAPAQRVAHQLRPRRGTGSRHKSHDLARRRRSAAWAGWARWRPDRFPLPYVAACAVRRNWPSDQASRATPQACATAPQACAVCANRPNDEACTRAAQACAARSNRPTRHARPRPK